MKTKQTGGAVLVAGATGDLGSRIVRALVALGEEPRALVRHEAPELKKEALRTAGAIVVEADFQDADSLARACASVRCVVSALAGLRDVVVGVQKRLLEGALAAGVPRFIPSDFCIDFTALPAGRNRNLDLRREFQASLDTAPLAATSIFNGAFAELLIGEAPFVLFPLRRVLCWGSPDQVLDFTAKDDVAAFTARAALDPTTPRFFRIAGDRLSACGLAKAASEATQRTFRVLRPGSLAMFEHVISLTRRISPGEHELYPAWQGMQYMRNMFDGRGRAHCSTTGVTQEWVGRPHVK